MYTKKYLSVFGYGFLIWFVPFVTSIFFYAKDGSLSIDFITFKTIMLLVSSLIGAWCMFRYFKRCQHNYLSEGVTIGLGWLAIQWLFDFLVLIPMGNIPISTYFLTIGLRYLMIPVTCFTTGALLELKSN